MAELTAAQVRAVLQPLGFNETEACANFIWFEYPTAEFRRPPPGKIIARLQFYIPRSEMDAWCYLPGCAIGIGERISDHVYYEANVRTFAEWALRQRLALIAARAAPKPSPELRALIIEANRDPGAARVLHSWLLDHGVDPF